jgi:hypothetical protein
MTPPVHPGKIVFVDDGVESVENAASVPESIRFVQTKVGLVPVVRIEAASAGTLRYIRSYGENGALLQSTTQIASGEGEGAQ